MNQKTLDLIHKKYQEALRKSSNILEIVKNLYNLSKDEEVDSADANEFYSFVDGLRACYRFRENTFASTNITTYITITVMYIIIWLNETYNLHLDINLYSRRKSLESELAKILRKSSETSSVNIRDRFGIRGVLLNSCNESEADDHIHFIFDALSGIVAAKNRKMKKEFIDWVDSSNGINELDKQIIKYVLEIPFRIEFIKDFIKNPKSNDYKSLQFTLTIQMYSNVLPGFQIEIQLKSLEMHNQAEHGSASHDNYKKYLNDDGTEDPINKVFVVDDFSELNIIGFTSYESKENDQDGIHFAKEFSDRRISTTLVPKN